MASETAKINFTVRRGDTTSFTQTLKVGTNLAEAVPFNLTGWQINAQVRYNPDNPNEWISLPITVIDAVNGKFRIKWTASQSAALLPVGSNEPASAGYDIQIRRIGDEENTTTTIQSGTFNVITDYTRVPVTP